MVRYFFIAVVVLFATSCTNKSTKSVETTEWTTSILQNAVPIEVDTIDLKRDFPCAEKLYYYSDSIIIAKNSRTENNYYYEFYNPQKDSIYKKCLRVGRGRDEAVMIGYSPSLSRNLLITGDMGKKQLFVFNVDSACSMNEYQPRKYNGFPFCGVLSTAFLNNTILMENPYFFSCKELGIEPVGTRFLIIDEEKNSIKNMPDYDVNTFNVNNSNIILTNEKEGIICFAHTAQSFIEFYDKDLNLIKRIDGPTNLPIEYKKKKDGLTFSKKVPYSYLKATSSDKYIFLFYVGNYYESIMNDINNHTYHIMQLDWHGNLIKTYKIDSYVEALSCAYDTSLGQEILYASIQDNDGTSKLLKLHLTE